MYFSNFFFLLVVQCTDNICNNFSKSLRMLLCHHLSFDNPPFLYLMLATRKSSRIFSPNPQALRAPLTWVPPCFKYRRSPQSRSLCVTKVGVLSSIFKKKLLSATIRGSLGTMKIATIPPRNMLLPR